MKLSNILNDALNQQVVLEYSNQMKMKQIESWFEDQQLHKIGRHFHEAANGEKSHASKFINHINSRTGGKVQLGEIGRIVFPDLNIGSVNDVADIIIKTEEFTSESIEKLYELAISENSYMDIPFLSKFLKIQTEEEDESNHLASQLRNVKDLVLFDKTFKVKK
jgi:ferritin